MHSTSGRMSLVSDQKVVTINYYVMGSFYSFNYIAFLPSKGMNLDVQNEVNIRPRVLMHY